jgi:hypothetical protein
VFFPPFLIKPILKILRKAFNKIRGINTRPYFNPKTEIDHGDLNNTLTP